MFIFSFILLLFCKIMETNKENIQSRRTRNNFKSKIPVAVEPVSRPPNVVQTARPPLKTIDKSKANITVRAPRLLKTNNDKKDTLKCCAKRVITYTKIRKNWAENIYKDKEVGPANSSNISVKIKPQDNEIFTEIHDNDVNKSEPQADKTDTTTSDNDSMKIETKERDENGNGSNYPDTSQHDHDIADIFSDEESDDKNETVVHAERELKTGLHVGKADRSVVTPASVIQHKGVKNVKKSLKRPHSRELQGISPVISNVNALDSKVKRRLSFDRLKDKMLSSDAWTETYTRCLAMEYMGDIFEYLQSVEIKPRGVPLIASVTRACLINWLMKLNGPDRNPAVIQTSCWYLDSYLSSTEVSLAKLQLVAAACYWIAQKLHGPMHSASEMAVYGNNAFTADNLREMEMKVLQTLRFPRQPVIPQEYITYLSWWCGEGEDREVETAATFMCLAGMMVDKSLCDEYPSIIAAAAVRSAVLLLKKTHLMNRLMKCPEYQKAIIKLSKRPLSLILRHAVRKISCPLYEYNVLLQHYGVPPHCISQKIVEVVKMLYLEPKDLRKGRQL